MPTKRVFDMVVITGLLMHPVVGLFKMWAARKASDPNAGNIGTIVGGAARIVS